MRLAIVGASARAAACSALEAGHRVVAADLFADADLVASCPATRITDWPQGFGPWLASQECDGWLYTGGLENYPDLVDQWAAVRPLLGAGGPVLGLVRNTTTLAKMLTTADVAFPMTLPALPDQEPVGQWLVKPLRSSGGGGVRRWQGDMRLEEGEFLQQLIEGTPISAVYTSNGQAATCWGVTRQLIAPPWTHATGYKYAGSIGPISLNPASRQAIERVGQVLAAATGIVGVWGADFILHSDGTPWVIEVNPRYTASMEVVERATGQSAVGLHLLACCERRLPQEAPRPPARILGKAYLYAPTGVMPDERWTSSVHQLASQRQAADIPFPGVPIAQGFPVTSLFAWGTSVGEVETQLRDKLAELTFRLPPAVRPILAADEGPT